MIRRRPRTPRPVAPLALLAAALLSALAADGARAQAPAAPLSNYGGQRVNGLRYPVRRHPNGRVREIALANSALVTEDGRYIVEDRLTLLFFDENGETNGVATAESGEYDPGAGRAHCRGPVLLDLRDKGVRLTGTNMTWASALSAVRIETNAVLTLRFGGESVVGAARPARETGTASRLGLPERGPDAPPTTIRSDSLEMIYTNLTARFEGGVVVTDPQFTLRTDAMVFVFANTNEVSALDCLGHVDATSGDLRVTGGMASYRRENALVDLTDSPMLEKAGSRLTGERMQLWLNESRAVVERNARIVIPPGTIRRDRGDGSKPGLSAFGARPASRAPVADGPTVATSDSMEFRYGDPARRSARLAGRVVITDPEFELWCDAAVIGFDEQDQVKSINCSGRVHLKSAEADVRCGRANYWRPEARVLLEESPVVVRGEQTLRGDRITALLDEERVLVEGHAHLETSPESFSGRDRAPGSPPSTVDSDLLDYRRAELLASFIGSAVVTDPELDLRSDRIDVHFAQDGNEVENVECVGSVDARVDDPRPDDGDSGGDVFVTSEHAHYDRAESLVVLTGDPLVRRAANKVAGDEISYNLNTGSIRSRGFRGTGVLPAEETP